MSWDLTKTVNEHLLSNIRSMKEVHGAYATDRWSTVPKYRRFNKRINFLLRIHRTRGRDHRLNMGEVLNLRLDPERTAVS